MFFFKKNILPGLILFFLFFNLSPLNSLDIKYNGVKDKTSCVSTNPASLKNNLSQNFVLYLPVNKCLAVSYNGSSSTTHSFVKIKIPPSLEDITDKMASGATYKVYATNEDTPFELTTRAKKVLGDKTKIIDGYKKYISTTSLAQNFHDYDFTKAKLTNLSYVKTEWYLAENKVGSSGTGQERLIKSDSSDKVQLNFPIPNDPVDTIMIHSRVIFSWKLEIPNTIGSIPLTLENQSDQINDFFKLVITDITPPEAIGFTPTVIFGTSGDWIKNGKQDFNFWLKQRGITSVPPNPDDLYLVVADNNPNSDLYWREGVYHNSNKINALIYAETYISQFTSKRPNRDIRKIEEANGEYFKGDGEPPEGIGGFVWVGPINLREYYLKGSSAPIKDLDNPITPITKNDSMGAGQSASALTVHIWKIPIDDLERALYKKLISQYPNLVNKNNRITFLGRHFASGCLFKFPNDADSETHGSPDLHYSSTSTSDMSLGALEFLRLTAAVSDASGNWSTPSFIPKTTKLDPNLFITIMGYKDKNGKFQPYFTPKLDLKTGAELPPASHEFILPIVVYDNDKPNPMIIMTARDENGVTKTTRFTIPNGDLAYPGVAITKSNAKNEGPYINDMIEWEFDSKGNSETMKWLKTNDPDRYNEYKKSLIIHENSRVVFEVVAYDNINKWVVSKDPFCYYGISTPITTGDVQDESLIRPVTWKIIDPTAENDPARVDTLYENAKDKIYMYPDYVFRNIDESKEYGVEVVVHDRSNFNEPSQNGGLTYNQRILRLKFKVLKDNNSWNDNLEKMGSEESVDRDSEKNKK